jgi:PKD repeat protein
VYTVSLTANGPGGSDTLTETNYITVTSAVTAAFSGTPLSGNAPLTVTFTNLSSGATAYEWAFGDGATSTTTHPVHTYTQIGSFTVVLTATAGSESDNEAKQD